MGLNWSRPKQINGNKLLLIKSDLPESKLATNKIWNLWRSYKSQLKQDGFNISKYPNTPNGVWSINYWVTINDDTYETINDEPHYATIFKQKYNKWVEKYNEVNTPFSSSIDDHAYDDDVDMNEID